MLKRIIAALLLMSVVFGFAFAAETDTLPTTAAEKFSYAMGAYCVINYGKESAMPYLQAYKEYVYTEIDLEFGQMGIDDTLNNSWKYTAEELNDIIVAYSTAWNEKLSAENLAAAEKFLAENKTKKDIITTKSGLQYKIVREGTGKRPVATSTVELDYKLTLLDGTVMDSSYDRGAHAQFSLESVIKGFSEGVQLMPIGSKYIFYIHPSLGYGERSLSGLGGNELLIFEVETYAIV